VEWVGESQRDCRLYLSQLYEPTSVVHTVVQLYGNGATVYLVDKL